MLSRIKRIFALRNVSITLRVTLWYSFFIFAILGALIGISLVISDKIIEDVSQKKLIKSVAKIANEKDEFEAFDDGIFFIKYDKNGGVIDGLAPKNFNASLKKTFNKIEIYKNGENSFYYYDSEFKNNPEIWLRGVVAIDGLSNLIGIFFTALLILAPILFFLIIYGGYKIIKNAFTPVSVMSQTALEIKKSNDFSKRIDIPEGKDELHKLAGVFNQMLDSLEKVYKSEKQLTSDISHDLRTPVSIILAESDYAALYAQNLDEAKESMDVINRQSKKIALLIDGILETARLEASANLSLKEINLSSILRELAKDYERLAKEKSINLICEIKRDILILGDEVMISRLAHNLLSNALKFTKTKIEIRLNERENFARLSIIDDGDGISNSKKEMIWNKFYQANESRNKDENLGNGLGLWIAAQIAKVHGAKIGVNSEIGEGSEFWVEFNILK